MQSSTDTCDIDLYSEDGECSNCRMDDLGMPENDDAESGGPSGTLWDSYVPIELE